MGTNCDNQISSCVHALNKEGTSLIGFAVRYVHHFSPFFCIINSIHEQSVGLQNENI